MFPSQGAHAHSGDWLLACLANELDTFIFYLVRSEKGFALDFFLYPSSSVISPPKISSYFFSPFHTLFLLLLFLWRAREEKGASGPIGLTPGGNNDACHGINQVLTRGHFIL